MRNTGFQNVSPLPLKDVYYSKKEVLHAAACLGVEGTFFLSPNLTNIYIDI